MRLDPAGARGAGRPGVLKSLPAPRSSRLSDRIASGLGAADARQGQQPVCGPRTGRQMENRSRSPLPSARRSGASMAMPRNPRRRPAKARLMPAPALGAHGLERPPSMWIAHAEAPRARSWSISASSTSTPCASAARRLAWRRSPGIRTSGSSCMSPSNPSIRAAKPASPG